jgi:hypothetical protein
MRTVTLAMLSLFITLIASSVFAQYQLRKTTTPTQQKTSITITDPSAKATWEKGQRYTIKWISEGRVPSVKIVLIDQANKSHDLVRSTTNSGSYTFTVSTRLPDGAYKVVVMTADGSVKGEGAGLVTVQKKSFGTTDRHAATGLTQQPRPGSGLSPSQPSGQIGQLPGTTPAVGQAGGVEVAVSGNADVGTVSGGTLSVTQASTSVAARLDQAVMDLYSPPDVQTADVGQYLRINTPAPDDWHTVWEPGGQYWVKWYSSEFGGRCQVVLRESGYYTYRIADDRPSRDSIFFTVPLDIRFSDYYNVIVTQDAPIDTARSVRIKVYQDQPVDLICAVDEFGTNHRGRFDPFGSRTMHFKLGIKNRGTDGPLVVPVLMQLIKHPEAVVVHQVEASIGGVYPGYWYFTEDNLNWDVRQFEESIPSGPGTGVYFRSGHYELKIELDYQNSLNEREDLRYNNSYVRKIRIID